MSTRKILIELFCPQNSSGNNVNNFIMRGTFGFMLMKLFVLDSEVFNRYSSKHSFSTKILTQFSVADYLQKPLTEIGFLQKPQNLSEKVLIKFPGKGRNTHWQSKLVECTITLFIITYSKNQREIFQEPLYAPFSSSHFQLHLRAMCNLSPVVVNPEPRRRQCYIMAQCSGEDQPWIQQLWIRIESLQFFII